MKSILTEGIPLINNYLKLLESERFKSMEQFSNDFLSTNREILFNYVKKWAKDPFHQWSRQWEYPFVLNRIQQIINDESKNKILDAGSGVTFFPYYLKMKFKTSHIYCCDYDKMLAPIYEQINVERSENIGFSNADLRNLPYEDESFNVVYCISVLEHTDSYKQIIDEFFRILLPGGKLIVKVLSKTI